MEYVNLGATGVRVSRICLGMMSYGEHESREWALDEAAAEPIVRRAVEGGINFFDTADVYNGGQQRSAHRTAAAQVVRDARGVRAGDQGTWGRRCPDPTARRPLAQAHHGLDRRLAGAPRARLRRPLPDPPLGSEHPDRGDDGRAARRRQDPARRATSVPAACSPGSSPRPRRVASTRFVSMQNHYNLIYREEEREMIPQCIDQGVAVIPWSPLARGLLAGNRTRTGERLTTRAQTDAFGDSLYKPEIDFDVIERADEVAAGARRVDGAGGARLAAAQARGDRTDRRRYQARAPRGRARRRAALAQREEIARAGGALCPARDRGTPMTSWCRPRRLSSAQSRQGPRCARAAAWS